MKIEASPLELRRTLRFSDLLLYGIILIQPTAPMPSFGVIYTTAHGHVVTATLLAMVAMLFTSLSYGHMAQTYPHGGSAFLYVSKELNPGFGYITGWCLVLDYVLNPLICTIWCSRAMLNFLPHIPYPIAAIFFASFFTLLNCSGVETSARINRGMTVALGLVIVLVVAKSILWLFHTHPAKSFFYLQPFYDPSTFQASQLLRGTSIAVLTYIGFDGISTLSDESIHPKRDIPRAIVYTCFITGLLASMEVYLAQLIWPRGAAFSDVDTAYVHVAQYVGGTFLFIVVNGALLLATIGSGLASQLGAARLLYAMGQDEALPKRFFGTISHKNRIPLNNVVLVGVISLCGALAFSYQLGTELLNYGALLAFMGVNLACIVRILRVREFFRWVTFCSSCLGFVTCFFLWLHLSAIALATGTAWGALGILFWAIRSRTRAPKETRVSNEAASL